MLIRLRGDRRIKVILDQVAKTIAPVPNHFTATLVLAKAIYWSAQTNPQSQSLFLPTLVLGLIATLFGGTSPNR